MTWMVQPTVVIGTCFFSGLMTGVSLVLLTIVLKQMRQLNGNE